MISMVLALLIVVMPVLNGGPSWAASPAEASSQADLPSKAQCKPIESAGEGINGEEPIIMATVKVYCGLRIFCPAEHRCCNVADTVWCCPLPATCDPDMDADDWTGCHGAHGVNPL